MKTVLPQVSKYMRSFFGSAQLNSVTQRKNNVMALLQTVKQLKAAKESAYYNVESRVAFVALTAYAKTKVVRNNLIEEMGITQRTFRNWKKDFDAYNEGKIQVRTVVIRKPI